jgi:hypothetical protein
MPECVVLPTRPGIQPDARGPVRIFLGTEQAQYRAERVFVYSVEQVRNPARRYEIYLMKDLPGFDRSRWRTGFTNYRFAIPELAEFSGRAMYCDVDQIFLRDPADLFDLPLHGHGYLAVSSRDISVSLIDCERMSRIWNLRTARETSKRKVQDHAARTPGLWGALDPGWNARDTEYDPQASYLVHFTALHLQPWQPTPDQYSYRLNPVGYLWHDLERRADAEKFELFSCQRPSKAFAAAVRRAADSSHELRPGPDAIELMRELGVERVLSVLRMTCADGWRPQVDRWVPGQGSPPKLDGSYDAIWCAGLLEFLPSEDAPWFIDLCFSAARKGIYLGIDLDRVTAPELRAGYGPWTSRWWYETVKRIASRYPRVAWHLDVRDAANPSQSWQKRTTGRKTPLVWGILGPNGGDNGQVKGLLRRLGLPHEFKALEFNAMFWAPPVLLDGRLTHVSRDSRRMLTGPWPDIAVGCGPRAVPVLRWIKKRSGGRTRIVILGRPRAPLDWFDLVITTPQYNLLARPNVLHRTLPIVDLDRSLMKNDARRWATRFRELPRPWTAVLLGGHSWPYLFTRRHARRLARLIQMDNEGALLFSSSRRTPPRALKALQRELHQPAYVYHWHGDGGENPFAAVLELADRFMVTGDSASMLAEAVATGKPTRILPLPSVSLFGWLVPAGWLTLWRRFEAGLSSDRGTPVQQTRLGRWIDRLIFWGWVSPHRDFENLHQQVLKDGLATLTQSGEWRRPDTRHDDDDAVAAVRELLEEPRQVGDGVRRRLPSKHAEAA